MQADSREDNSMCYFIINFARRRGAFTLTTRARCRRLFLVTRIAHHKFARGFSASTLTFTHGADEYSFGSCETLSSKI